MGRKYEFTGEVIEFKKRKLRRIRRLSDGLVGGFIESEINLTQSGNSFVYDQAKVFGKARIRDGASVKDCALVFGRAVVGGVAVISEGAMVYHEARVTGAATVSGHAKVYQNAKVRDYAQIKDDVHICCNAEVSGHAEVRHQSCIGGNVKLSNKVLIIGETWLGWNLSTDKGGKLTTQGERDENAQLYGTVAFGHKARNLWMLKRLERPTISWLDNIRTAICDAEWVYRIVSEYDANSEIPDSTPQSTNIEEVQECPKQAKEKRLQEIEKKQAEAFNIDYEEVS